jgi:hypothetical protein
MATEQPAGTPPSVEYTIPEEYQFDPGEDFSPENEWLDVVLTRAGELVLDLIEGVQEHPTLAASIVGIGFGAIVGLLAASVVPRRRPAPRVLPTAAAADAALESLAPRLGAVRGRLSQVAETAGTRLRDSRHRLETAPPIDLSAVRANRLGGALSGLWPGGRVTPPPTEDLVDSAAERAQRARYFAQLLPIGMSLLRHPVVRDLVAQTIAARIRRRAHI